MTVIIIKTATSDEDRDAMARVRREVFEREQGIARGRLQIPDDADALHLLACTNPGGKPVATLSVIDTTGKLQDVYPLGFSPDARTARFVQLAVLRTYRGLDIPLALILEAHRNYIVPGRFDYTWLLFDAERAPNSALCRWFAFVPSEHTFPSEYGISCLLLRDESASRSKEAIREVEQYLERRGRRSCNVHCELSMTAHHHT